MREYDAEVLARNLMREHGLIHTSIDRPVWRFEFDTAVKRFGCCHHSARKITLSRALVRLNAIEKVTDTILHEIAHALVGGGHGHNHVWKRKCIEIGARPVRCYDTATTETVQLRYRTQCCAANTTSKAKRPTGCFTCRKCGQVVSWLDTKTGERFTIPKPVRRTTTAKTERILFEFNVTSPAMQRAFREAAQREATAPRRSGPCRKPRGLGGQGI